LAKLQQQMRITTKDEIGKLARCSAILGEKGINVLAACAWVEGDTGQMLLITDDNQAACAALREEVTRCEMQEVVTAMVPNKPGAMRAGAKALADAGISIRHMHATTSGAAEAMIVMDTSDNARAVEILGA